MLVVGVGERGAITNSLSLTHRQERAQPETARGVKRIPNQAGVFQEEEEEEQDRRKGKEEDRRVPIPVSCPHSQPASAPSVSVSVLLVIILEKSKQERKQSKHADVEEKQWKR